jgi:hypothetical protein
VIERSAADRSRAKPLLTHIWAQDPDGHYVEPSWTSERLCEEEWFGPPGSLLFDPACGWGRILKSAAAAGYTVLGADVVDRLNRDMFGCIPFATGDFLARPPLPSVPGIVCNPPFDQIQAFCERALETTFKVAMLVPLPPLAGCTLARAPAARNGLATDAAAVGATRAVHRGRPQAGQRFAGFLLARLPEGTVCLDAAAAVATPRCVAGGDVVKTRLRPTTFMHAIAMHEAAHAVVAVVQNLSFAKVDIIPDHKLNLNGSLSWDNNHKKLWRDLRDYNTDPHISSLAERRIITGLAGAVAQRRFAKSSDWRGGARGDHENADRWLQRLIGGSLVPNDPFARDEAIEPFPDDSDWMTPSYHRLNRKALKTYRAKYRRRAKALVEQYWPKIQIVAAALLERKTLSYAEVCKLMTEARRIPRNKGTRK